MKTDFEYIVLGLGGFGSAAAYWLARRAGTEVLGLEQFELGHVRGESQDHSRIIRLSYHTPGYVELAKFAYRAWEELERDSGEQVVLRTGGLDLGPRESAIPLSSYSDSMDAAGVELRAARCRRDHAALAPVAAGRRRARALSGAERHRHGGAGQRGPRADGPGARRHPPRSHAGRGDPADRRRGRGSHRRRDLPLPPPGDHGRRLVQPRARVRSASSCRSGSPRSRSPTSRRRNLADFQPDRFPIWIWMDDPCFYGFPAFGEPGPKVGQDAGGQETTADTRTFDPDADALDRVLRFLERHLPGALGPIIYTKTCLYTLTPDRDFVLDVLPHQPEIAVAIGGGHGFKFASLVGQILSELSIDGQSPRDLTPFRIDRPILQMKDPPRNYMV